MIGEFHFLRPWWWLALIALPALWFALRRGDAQWRTWAKVVDAHLLPHLVTGAETARRAPMVLACLAWIVAVAALAGPAWERLPIPVQRNQAATVIAFELSPTMLAADLKPDRLTRACFKVRDLLARLRDGQVALVGYAGDAFVVAPLTDDAKTVENLLDGLDPTVMPVGGNATAVAIRRGVDLIAQSGQRGGDLILVADSVSADATAAANAAAAQGVRVSVLAVGTAQGAPVSLPQGDFLKDTQGNIVIPKLDAAALAAVAQAGGGRYVDAAGDVAPLADRGVAPASPGGVALADEVASQQWRDRGPWLALALIPLALAGFRRGWLMLAVFAVGAGATAPARAFDFADLWASRDRQAWNALEGGDAKRAQELAQDADLRGAAAFRAGDYAAATREYAASEDAESAYNRGNALAQQQQWQEAIKAWDEAIAQNPGHADAQANKQAVEAWLKKQQQNQQKPDDKNGKSAQGGQGESGGGEEDQQQQGDKRQGEQNSSPQEQNESADGKPSGSDDSKEGAQNSRGGTDPERSADGKDGERSGEAGAEKDAQKQQEQRETFRKAMDKAVEQAGKEPEQGQAAKARVESDTQREQRQAVEQWLERVPDDPGGLLRRKFQLEYERRQRDAGKGEW
jgi:Ca-activated chloride channel family protein